MLQVGETQLFGRQVNRQFRPIVGIEIGKPPVEQSFGRGDQLNHRAHAVIERSADRR